MVESQDQLEAAESSIKSGTDTVHSINVTAQDFVQNYRTFDISCSPKTDYEKLVKVLASKTSTAADLPIGGKSDFRLQIFESLRKYRRAQEEVEKSKKDRFNRLNEALKQRIHEISMQSITRKLMLIELFNDFCDAKFFLYYKTCQNGMVPQLNDTFEDIKAKLNNMELDELEPKGSGKYELKNVW